MEIRIGKKIYSNNENLTYKEYFKCDQILKLNIEKYKLRYKMIILRYNFVKGMPISTYLEQKIAIMCNIEVINKELNKLINDKNSK